MRKTNGATLPPSKRQTTTQVRFTSEEIHQAMTTFAREDERSLNGEIMHALREFIRQRAALQESLAQNHAFM